MTKKHRAALLLLLCWMLGLISPAVRAANSAPVVELYPGATNPGVSASAAILVRPDTGAILFGQNIHERRAPASITKLMTVWLGAELGDYDAMVTITNEDFFDITPDGTSANLQVGESIRFEDLLYCAMLISANEACNVIARHVAGSVPAFLELVNERLRELGCEDSYFATTHGLPNDGHYTSAYDLSMILQACMTSDAFMTVATATEYYCEPTNLTPEGRSLKTGNHMISTLRQGDKYYYPYALCGKTGFTNAAGRCFAAAAEKDGIPLICVVLNATTEQPDSIASFAETLRLFEWGYRFEDRLLIAQGELLGEQTLDDGQTLTLVARDDVYAYLPEELTGFTLEFALNPLAAPMTEGDILGQASVVYNSEILGVTGVLSGSTLAVDAFADIAITPSEVRYAADFAVITAAIGDSETIPVLTLRDVTEGVSLPQANALVRLFSGVWSLFIIAALLGGWKLFARSMRQSRVPRLLWVLCILLAAANILVNVLKTPEPASRLYLAVEVSVEPAADCVLTIPISLETEQSLRVWLSDGTEIPYRYDGETVSAAIDSGGVYCVQLIEAAG